MLDWEINCQFAGLVWAGVNGLYEDAGLDVRLVPPSTRRAAPILDAVREAPLAAGCMEDNLIVRAAADGAGVKAIGAMLQETPMVLMTAAGNGVRTLADLSGLRVGVHRDGVHLLDTILALHGVDRASMDIVVGGWTLDDLIRGRLDAAQGYAITEPAYLEAAGFHPHLISVAHSHLHPYAQMMFATVECIREHAGPLSRFLRATFDGWRAALADPGRAARHVAAVSEEQPDAEGQRPNHRRHGADRDGRHVSDRAGRHGPRALAAQSLDLRGFRHGGPGATARSGHGRSSPVPGPPGASLSPATSSWKVIRHHLVPTGDRRRGSAWGRPCWASGRTAGNGRGENRRWTDS